MTLGALQSLRNHDIAIPFDMSIVGFDDLTFASLLNPPLTVVRRDDKAQGKRAAQLLFERINGEGGQIGRSVTVAVELMLRSSTSAPGPRFGR